MLAAHQAQDRITEPGAGTSELQAPLRKPDVASQISGHEGCSTVYKLLMSAAEADLAHSISIGGSWQHSKFRRNRLAVVKQNLHR